MTGSRIVEFVGLPGVGKTTISAAVAREIDDRGKLVHEPTHKMESYPRYSRIGHKSRFACSSLFALPQHSLSQTLAILNSDQESFSDFVRVLFNYHYIAGVIASHRREPQVCLLDQGLYQSILSIGLQSANSWNDLFTQFGCVDRLLSPDLVIFVEADNCTIAERLSSRKNGETRVDPNSSDFARIEDGIQNLKKHLQTNDGVETMTIRNETRGGLEENASSIADRIISPDL